MSRLANARRTRSKLWPGEPGTRRLAKLYGEKLVCVRYLYDAVQRKRFTTVELIVDEGPWKPRHEPKLEADAVVGVRIVPGDWAVERKIQAAGGTWAPNQKVWRLWYDRVVELGLQSRIVPFLESREDPPRPASAAPKRPPGQKMRR